MGTRTRGFANFIGADGKLQSGSLAAGVGGPAWQSVQTTGFTAVAGRAYPCNTTSAGFTVTLPASPSAGDEVILVDYAGTWDTNNLTINPNSQKILAQTSNVTASKDREAFRLVYIDNTQGWIPYSGYQEGTSGLSIPIIADFLVIAGGGAGGFSSAVGGAGGAGGYRSSNSTYGSSGGGATAESSLTLTLGAVYTITVGAGGSGSQGAAGGANGSNSSISGTGITTITSTGGGGGGGDAGTEGFTGGSGGGGSGSSTSSASGTANQGYAGGFQSNDGYGSSGGGGAGQAGSNSTGSGGGVIAGNGGNGVASTITGSSVTRGGGGGGGDWSGGSFGTGGTGGGGRGCSNNASNDSTNGTANTGGGAGGQSSDIGTRKSGGSGVVILRLPTAQYSGTTTGSPTVGTDGTDTILTFNDSGSYTG